MAWIFNNALIILEGISRQCSCAKGLPHVLVNQFLIKPSSKVNVYILA